MSSATSASMAAVAAAQRKRQLDQEEETETTYMPEDLNNKWEFKILRANTMAFKDQYTLKKVIEEESRTGWEFLEKFDDARLRFKRKISNRSNDANATTDPYRTTYGVSQAWIISLFFLLILAFTLVSMFLATYFENRY